jgi:hypothetical protein
VKSLYLYVPNLLAMCELTIFYTLYILTKSDLASWAIVIGNNKVAYILSKDQANKLLRIKFYKYMLYVN